MDKCGRAGWTDLESRLEKINVKEVRKEEGAKDNGTLLIFNFRR
jgi:hypothetical protein